MGTGRGDRPGAQVSPEDWRAAGRAAGGKKGGVYIPSKGPPASGEGGRRAWGHFGSTTQDNGGNPRHDPIPSTPSLQGEPREVTPLAEITQLGWGRTPGVQLPCGLEPRWGPGAALVGERVSLRGQRQGFWDPLWSGTVILGLWFLGRCPCPPHGGVTSLTCQAGALSTHPPAPSGQRQECARERL